MVRINDIKTGLIHLIGWRQDYNSDIVLANSLTESASGIYFQQAHPLLTLSNIKSVAPDFNNISYRSYDNEHTYILGEPCFYKDKSYRALKETVGEVPDSNEEAWEVFDPFSEWLETKTKDSISSAIATFVNSKILDGANKLLENVYLFDGAGRLADKVSNEDALVGFELIPIRSKGVTLKINKIGLQFTKAGAITLYLMHSSSLAAVRSISLTYTKPNSVQWFTMQDLFLPYVSTATDAGGSWYLTYRQDELIDNNQAIYRDRDWSKQPCTTCSIYDYSAWTKWSKYFEVHPFKVNKQNISEGSMVLWNITNNLYTYSSNYGLNLEVSAECDITDFILEQRGLFREIILKQVGVDFLKEMAYNPNVRVNRNAMNASRGDILFELQGDTSGFKRGGLIYELEKAYKAISMETNGIDRICLPCKSKGIRYRTV